MPSRPLLKLTGPGRHGQKCGHPQVSVHLWGVTPESLDRWLVAGSSGLHLSVSWTLAAKGRHGCHERPRSQALPSRQSPSCPPPRGSGEPPAAPGLDKATSTVLAVMCTCVSSRASSSESLSAKTCSLFLPNYVQDKYLLQLLRSADDVSTWVAAEIVTSHTSKVGASSPHLREWFGVELHGHMVPPVEPPVERSSSAGNP